MQRYPAQRGHPFLVGNDDGRRGRVVDASPECLAAGVTRGMAIREAIELVPAAALLPWNPAADADVLGRALDLLDRFSEVVEESIGDGAWFIPAASGGSGNDERRLAAAIVDGLAATLGLDARVGIGSGKFIARVAAERAAVSASEIVSTENGAAYLAPLPLELLPLLPSGVERLKLLGISTIGELARLPPDTLPRRFGREAALASQLARGDDRATLVPRRQPATLAMRRSFEPPIEDRGILHHATKDLLENLLRQLQRDRRAFRSLVITVGLEDGRLAERRADLRDVTSDLQRCLALLQSMIEALTLDQAVAYVVVRLGAIDQEPPRQGELFGKEFFDRARAERRERVVAALTEIGRRYRGRLRRVAPGDDPQSLLDDRRLMLLPVEAPGLDEPKPTRRSGSTDVLGLAESAIRVRPISLIARRERIYLAEAGWQRDEIVALHARWEADDWWPDATRRTYYRVRTNRGMILTLARDHEHQRWLLVESFE